MKIRLLLLLLVLAAFGVGVAFWLRAPKKPSYAAARACPPVRTALAVAALLENPAAKTYAAFGPGAGAFTNVFAHAGLACVTSSAVPADLVFVSGESANDAICHWKACCATNGLLAIHFDVRKKTFVALRRELETLPAAWSWRLWFPGRADALVTVFVDAVAHRVHRPHLADMLDLFAREELFADLAHAGLDSVSSVLASFACSREAALSVCRTATGEVVPECFTAKEVEPFVWIDCTGVDADIRDRALYETWWMLQVRRMVLEGDILSRDGKMDAAMEKWTTAIAPTNNPNDTLILERICQLDVNAETFMKVGNFPMASQCLETMVCLRPKDVPTLRRLARVFQQMGKKDLAAAVSQRADELQKAALNARVSRPQLHSKQNKSYHENTHYRR